VQVFLFPFGVGTLCVYTFALPGLALWHLRKNKEAVLHDQLLRAKGTGDDRLSNPKYYDWRRAWSKLYSNYIPSRWYWEWAIMGRKCLIAVSFGAAGQRPERVDRS